MKKTLYGPNLIRVELDKSQVFKDDPGSGTPALVIRGDQISTYHFACGEGQMNDGTPLSERQWEWLFSIEAQINAFLEW